MKTTGIKRIALGGLFAAFMAVAAVAPAAGWRHYHAYRVRYVAPVVSVGVACAPAYIVPANVAPAIVEPVIGADVVIGGGYYHRAPVYVRRVHWR